jgi:hypothetical protein
MKKKVKKLSAQSEIQPKKGLQGFYVRINSFGEIERSHSVEEINRFLNQHVVDKKLKDRFGYKSDENDDTVRFLYEND